MHELSIAQNIIQILNSTVEQNRLGLVDKIHLKIGLLCNVMIESLNFSYNSIVENTPLQNSTLEIEILPIKITCNDCGEINTTYDFIFFCPACNSSAISVISGDEMIISSVQLNEESE